MSLGSTKNCYFVIDKRERPGSKRQTSLLSYFGVKQYDEATQQNVWIVKPEFAKRVRFSNLDCGDVCFYINDQPRILIERKDVKDLAGCINSKSYKEQKFRMQKYKSETPQLELVYLIEDFQVSSLSDLSTIVNPAAPKTVHINKQTILSSVVSSMFRDGFFVHTTVNLEGTIAFIERIYVKLPTYPNKVLTSDEGKSEYLKQIDVSKSKNIDSKSWFLLSLSQIPGVSLDKAKSIAEKYGSFPALITAYEQCEKKEQMLSSIPKIGKVLSQRVCEYLN